jgi:hypothetical protein
MDSSKQELKRMEVKRRRMTHGDCEELEFSEREACDITPTAESVKLRIIHVDRLCNDEPASLPASTTSTGPTTAP